MTSFGCPYLEALRNSVFWLACRAFAEDLPAGDATAQALRLGRVSQTARILCREPVVMNGAAWFDAIRRAFLAHTGESAPAVVPQAQDGEVLERGSVLFLLEGSSEAIVAFERTFLNFLGRGIGIAKLTQACVTALRRAGCPAHVMDTRKTLPGYRFFDKYAVLCGGGTNHRMSLSDQVLIKENHIAAFGDIERALLEVMHVLGSLDRVIVEAQNPAQVRQAIDVGCPIVMLDNFSPEAVHQVCEWERGATQLEVSGGVTLENISAFAHPALDRVSVGALTHSVQAPDLTLLADEEPHRHAT